MGFLHGASLTASGSPALFCPTSRNSREQQSAREFCRIDAAIAARRLKSDAINRLMALGRATIERLATSRMTIARPGNEAAEALAIRVAAGEA